VTIRKVALAAGGFVAFLASAGLIYLVVIQYLSQPLGQLYHTLTQLIALAPQDWVWAAIIALTVLFGLRNISSQRKLAEAVDPKAQSRSESLESWLLALQERKRGPYFGWRLASQLAELESQIADQADRRPAHQIREYLKMGRDRRTIGTAEAIISSYSDIHGVVTYLEQADHGS
jgi:hypothetical protein